MVEEAEGPKQGGSKPALVGFVELEAPPKPGSVPPVAPANPVSAPVDPNAAVKDKIRKLKWVYTTGIMALIAPEKNYNDPSIPEIDKVSWDDLIAVGIPRNNIMPLPLSGDTLGITPTFENIAIMKEILKTGPNPLPERRKSSPHYKGSSGGPSLP